VGRAAERKMKRCNLLFLWHMHQPSYVDALTRSLALPWVRMHAVRGYLDMARVAARFPEFRHTFNFTPSLLDQIEGLATGRIDDDVRRLCAKSAADLGADERAFVVRHFFSIAFEHNIRPLHRYAALWAKRGPEAALSGTAQIARAFSTQEIRDLEVFFHLAWCGAAARAEDDGLEGLYRKGGDYTEADKSYVLHAFDRILAGILPAYRALADAGIVELSTTPHYHPILPLIVDSNVAARALPERPLPPRFSFPDDAREHVRRAAATHAARFGARPKGMWPAEGSISPEVVPMFEEAGVEWVASDEGVLFHSLDPGAPRRSLYRTWQLPGGEGRLCGYFRDRGLSDLIGFTYYKRTPEAAASDFVGHLATIAAHTDGPPAQIVVILDGENPWEHYPRSGVDHLHAMFTAIEQSPIVETRTFARATAESTERPALSRLHSGSWIESSFRIWIGGEEENRAWSVLGDARRAVAKSAAEHHPRAHEAREHVLVAEGSDWFWWFGDDFASEQKPEFDRLFRARLSAAWRAIGEEPPAALREPILRAHVAYPARPPRSAIDPRPLGSPDVLGWLGSGRCEIGASRQSMYGGAPRFSALWFGAGGGKVFLRLVPGRTDWRVGLAGGSIRVEVRGPKGAFAKVMVLNAGRVSGDRLEAVLDSTLDVCADTAMVAELGDRVEVALGLLVEGAEGERYPPMGHVSVALCGPSSVL
jgi:alpha-amylase/alpha-mannosidase (GH57 family)